MSDHVSIPSPSYRLHRRRRRGMDRATRRLALIAAGLGGTLVAIVGFWSASGHRPAAVPVIEADSRPVRIKPENPGGLQVAGSNDEILSGDAGAGGDKLLPPPESPAPRGPAGEAARTGEEVARPPSPATARQPADAAPAPAEAAPLASAVPPAAEARAIERRTVAAPAAAGASERMAEVQFAALDSEHAATAEWQRLQKRMPDLLGNRRPSVERAERGGRTIWRLRTGGFEDIAHATSFCERVRSKGTACSLATF